MKDHEIAKLVSELAAIAREYGTHQSIRQRISNLLVPILKEPHIPVEASRGENK